MRVLLKLELDCSPDAAWDAIRSPEVFQWVARPWLRFESLEAAGFPTQWSGGRHPVAASALGVLPIGTQTIDLRFERRGDVRLVHDRGLPDSGPLHLITFWHHTMAVSPLPEGRTLFRDQLRFEAWLASPFLWPAMWAFWQWRGARIRFALSTTPMSSTGTGCRTARRSAVRTPGTSRR